MAKGVVFVIVAIVFLFVVTKLIPLAVQQYYAEENARLDVEYSACYPTNLKKDIICIVLKSNPSSFKEWFHNAVDHPFGYPAPR
jgi:hypothetical protein